MSERAKPYIGSCGFCEQGLVRLQRCLRCGAVAAICDECELVWRDIAVVSLDPLAPSSGSYPICPTCGSRERSEWQILDSDEASQEGLGKYVAGESA